jgi:hypothetical protein
MARPPSTAQSEARPSLFVESIKIVPQVLWFSLAIVVIVISYKPLVDHLDKGDISKVSFAAFDIEFVRSEFSKAAPNAFSTPAQFTAFADRIQKEAAQLRGARALWVDSGNPTQNFQERSALMSLGIAFDLARNNEEAQNLFDLADKAKLPYDFVISNMRDKSIDRMQAACFPRVSPAYQDGACQLIQIVKGRYPDQTPPIILYSGDVRGVPPGALGATDRFDELALLVLDALERRHIAAQNSTPNVQSGAPRSR